MDFEVFFVFFLHKPHSSLNFFLCQFHDPDLEKAISGFFIYEGRLISSWPP